SAAPLAAIPFGAQLEEVAGRPVESWNDVQEILRTAPAGPLVLSFADAPDVSLTLPAEDSARAATLAPLQPLTEPIVGEVTMGSPAERIGLQPGDRIVSAAGEPISTWPQFVEIVRARPGETIPLVLERDGQQV